MNDPAGMPERANAASDGKFHPRESRRSKKRCGALCARHDLHSKALAKSTGLTRGGSSSFSGASRNSAKSPATAISAYADISLATVVMVTRQSGGARHHPALPFGDEDRRRRAHPSHRTRRRNGRQGAAAFRPELRQPVRRHGRDPTARDSSYRSRPFAGPSHAGLRGGAADARERPFPGPTKPRG